MNMEIGAEAALLTRKGSVWQKRFGSDQWAAALLQRVANQWVAWGGRFHSNQHSCFHHHWRYKRKWLSPVYELSIVCGVSNRFLCHGAPEIAAVQNSGVSYRVFGPLALENDGVSAHVEEAQVCRGVRQQQHRTRGYPLTDHLQHQFFLFLNVHKP